MADVIKKRPVVLAGVTLRLNTGCGKMYITLNRDNKGLYEAFAVLGKGGGCPAAHLEGLARIVTLALKGGMSVLTIIKSLRGIRCPNPKRLKEGWVLSCADALGIALETYEKHKDSIFSGGDILLQMNNLDVETFKKGSGELKNNNDSLFNIENKKMDMHKGKVCPECGAKADLGGGCLVCTICGFSKC